jgi:hypothetical protein
MQMMDPLGAGIHVDQKNSTHHKHPTLEIEKFQRERKLREPNPETVIGTHRAMETRTD